MGEGKRREVRGQMIGYIGRQADRRGHRHEGRDRHREKTRKHGDRGRAERERGQEVERKGVMVVSAFFLFCAYLVHLVGGAGDDVRHC